MNVLGDKIKELIDHNRVYSSAEDDALEELDELIESKKESYKRQLKAEKIAEGYFNENFILKKEAELWRAFRLSALKNTITYFVGDQCFVVENYGTSKERNFPLLEWYKEQLEKGVS